MALKLEDEFAHYAAPYRRVRRHRTMWQAWSIGVVCYLLVPVVLLSLAAVFPTFPTTMIRWLDQINPSDNPMNPANARPPRSLP